jgi:spore coat assembly protein
MEINSLVTRNKYNNDIIFRIIDIKDNRVMLKGEVVRLIADAEINDLRLFSLEEKKKVFLPKLKEEDNVIKGKVLHIDGDEYYLKKAIDTYSKYNINAIGYFIKESEMPYKIEELLKKHHPDIVVITGHDAYYSNRDKFDINSYKNSLYYVESVKKARVFNSNKDDLIIIAGACQSYYEKLIEEGANFASSPTRSNIHLLDPIIIASFISNYRINEKIDIEYILSNTISKSLGGIESKGKARKIFVGEK